MEIRRTAGRSPAFLWGRLFGYLHRTTLPLYRTAPDSFDRHILSISQWPIQAKPPARLSPSRNPPMPENRSIYVIALGITLLISVFDACCYTINRHPSFQMVKDLYMKTAPQGAEAEPQSCGAAVAFTRDLLRRHPLWAELRYSARCHPHRDRGILRLPGRFQPAPADSHAQRLWRPRILLRLPPAPARSG